MPHNTGYEALFPLGGPGRRMGTPAWRRARLTVLGDTSNSVASRPRDQPSW
jgi:hypothetical protein